MATKVKREKTLNGVATRGRASKPVVVWNGSGDRQGKCFSLVQRSSRLNPTKVPNVGNVPTRLRRLLSRTPSLQI